MTTLTMLKALDSELLSEFVRKDQRSPTLELGDWVVESLGHNKIIDTTGGLYRFRGIGSEGHDENDWSIVLKIINNPNESHQHSQEWGYWKREPLVFASNILAELPDPLATPRCYGVTEREDGVWIWMEDVKESTGKRWSMDQFHFAAQQMGRFAAAYLKGTAQPEQPWLCPAFFRSVWADGGWWSTFMNPKSPQNAWQSDVVKEAFSDSQRAEVLRICAEKERFFDALERLPQVFCHNDLHRRNLMVRTRSNGQEELVALDWAFCGPGAVGTDMAELVAPSTYFFESNPNNVAELEKTVLEGYLDALQAAGFSVDPRLVRLGYCVSATFWMGVNMPGWVAWILGKDSNFNVEAIYGRPHDEVLTGWLTLFDFVLERTDEARHLIDELGLL